MVAVNHVMDIIVNHKLLKDLKELAEYDQSTSTDHHILLNDNEDHHVQNRESPKNSFEEIVVSNPDQEKKPEATTDTELSSTKDIHPLAVQESPHDYDICQLIREECSIEVPEQQKQKMEDTMFDLPAERRNRAEKSWQNFKVVHKSFISFKNTSQISLIHSIAPIESTKEPEHLLSMGYEHLSITPETESDEVTESNAENLLPILSKCEVTLENEIECDMPANDNCSLVFTTFSNPLFKDNDDLDSSNDESLLDKDEEIHLIENLLYDNSFSRPPKELNAEIADTIIESIPLLPIPVRDDNSQQEEIDIDYRPKIKDFLCRILSWFSRPLYPLLDSSLGKSISVIYIAYS
nr:hypothetical protein [Tanacetum cinerariifolium]